MQCIQRTFFVVVLIMASNKMSPLLQFLYQLASFANNGVDLLANWDLSLLAPCLAFAVVDENQIDAQYYTIGRPQPAEKFPDNQSSMTPATAEECDNNSAKLSDCEDDDEDTDEYEEESETTPPCYRFHHRELKLLNRRLKRTLYCEFPASVLDSPSCSWSLTEHVLDVIDRLTKSCGGGKSSLSVENSKEHAEDFISTFLVTQEFHPCAIIQALVYCDRYRNRCRQGPTIYVPPVHTIRSGTDAFLAALMLASKMLHDSGEEGDVYNKLWADESNRSNSALNKLEMEFAAALDWNLNITLPEFWAQLLQIEAQLVWKRQQQQASAKNGPNFTYSELSTLHDWMAACAGGGGAIRAMIEQTVKVILLCTSAYVASIVVAAALSATVLVSRPSSNTASGTPTSTEIDCMPSPKNYSSYAYDNNVVIPSTDYYCYGVDRVAGKYKQPYDADDGSCGITVTNSNATPYDYAVESDDEENLFEMEQYQQRRVAATVSLIRLALRRQLAAQRHSEYNYYYYDDKKELREDENYGTVESSLVDDNSSVFYELAKPKWVTTSIGTSGGGGSYFDNWMPAIDFTKLNKTSIVLA